MKRWNTVRVAMYGAAAGLAYAAFNAAPYWSVGSEGIGQGIGMLVGGATMGFVMVAAICGFRNLLVRAK